MDNDFYFEDSNPKKVVAFVLVLLILLGAGGYYFYKEYYNKVIKINDVIIELGEKPSEDLSVYAKGNTDGYTLKLADNLANEEGVTYLAGEYSFRLVKGDVSKKGKIYVKDTTPPVVTVKKITVGVNEKFSPYEFLETCDDLSLPCTTSYKKESYATLNKAAGEYNLEIVVEDKYGNKTTKDVTLEVSETESLLSKKQLDFTVASMTPKDDDWKDVYTYKFERCVDGESDEYEKKFLEINTLDFSSLFEKKIVNQYSITLYNQYNYVIGISVKLFFEDNTTKYLTSDDIKSLIQAEE